MKHNILIFQIKNYIFMCIYFVRLIRIGRHFDNISTTSANNILLLFSKPLDRTNIILGICIPIAQQLPPQGILQPKPLRIGRINQPLQDETISAKRVQVVGSLVECFGLQITSAPVQVYNDVLVQEQVVDRFMDDSAAVEVDDVYDALGRTDCDDVEVFRVQCYRRRLVVDFDFGRGSG